MDSFTFLVVCLLCIFGFSQQASGSLSLSMTPHYLQINARSKRQVNITCVLRDEAGQPVPLAGCGFKERYDTYIWQFNDGHASPNYTYTTNRGNKLTGIYQGQGLEHGECGMTFRGYENSNLYIVGCRVKPVTGRWQTAAMLLRTSTITPMQYDLEPRVIQALAGSNVTITGTAERALDYCWFIMPTPGKTVRFNFNFGPTSRNYSEGRYHGAGLEKKECGITLHDVQAERNVFLYAEVGRASPRQTFHISLYDQPDISSSDLIELIVMSAPESPPLLTVLTPGELNHGDFLEATCLVSNSRPAANITWHVGDEEVTSGITEDDDLDSTWWWNHDPQTVQSRLRLQVDSSHSGKKLLCRANHLAWTSGFQNSASVDIRVNG